MQIRTLFAATALGFALLATPALAEVVNYHADLKAADEVPPNDSTGSGSLDATYDTESKVLAWTISYNGLTGPVTKAHFHGPADPGENADPVVPLDGDLTVNPIEGQATLTDDQAGDLDAGKWYFNLHTDQYPDGEVRGQMMKASGM
jgi:hypothetical protein